MQKSVTKYFVAANDAINSGGFLNDNKNIPSAYKGAVSAFGASIIMSGLVPTMQFYMADSENKRDTESIKIVTAIARIINPQDTTAEKLKQEVLNTANNPSAQYALKKKITDAAIALKIMMRTYHFEKPTNAEN